MVSREEVDNTLSLISDLNKRAALVDKKFRAIQKAVDKYKGEIEHREASIEKLEKIFEVDTEETDKPSLEDLIVKSIQKKEDAKVRTGEN